MMEVSEEHQMAYQENLQPNSTRQEAARKELATLSEAERVPFQQVSHNLGGPGNAASLLGQEAGALLLKLEKRASRIRQDLETGDDHGPDTKLEAALKDRENESPQVSKQARTITQGLETGPVNFQETKLETAAQDRENESPQVSKRAGRITQGLDTGDDHSPETKLETAAQDREHKSPQVSKRAIRITQGLETGNDHGPDTELETAVHNEENETSQVSKRALGKAERVLATVDDVSEAKQSDGARRVYCFEEESVKDKASLAWFPRAKKDSYLERKIKKLQESEGPKEHLGEAFVKKMSLVEREKKAAGAAAEAALAAKKAALVEVSWCRILEAAGIHSDDAHVRARAAESEASKAANAAVSLGVVLSPNGPNRASPFGASRVSRGYRDVIFAATHSEADVEKEVVTAVKEALRKAKETLTAGEGKSASESKMMASENKDGKNIFQPSSAMPDATTQGDLSETPKHQDRNSAEVDSQNGNAETLQSPGKDKSPAASLFGGLLMACLSSRRKAHASSGEEDGSSSEEEENQETEATKEGGYEQETDSEDDEKTAPLLLWGQKKIRSKAAQRYAQATESDEEEGHVTSPLRAFSPAKSPAYMSPSKAPGCFSPAKSPAYMSPSKAPGCFSPAKSPAYMSPSKAPGCFSPAKSPAYMSPSKAPGCFSPAKSPAYLSPSKALAQKQLGSPTPSPHNELDVQKETDEERMVSEMLKRLVGLSEEQRQVVGSIVAARGFGGFLENSPFLSRPKQAAKPNGLGDDFVIKRSKLEIAKAEAVAKAKQGEPQKEQTRAVQSNESEQGLGEILVKRMSKLEKAKADAIAARKLDEEKQGQMGKQTATQASKHTQAFGEDLVIHKSKLERAKEEAVAAAKSDGEKKGRAGNGRLKEGQSSVFGEDLVIHKSKLERAKEEAVSAAKSEGAQNGRGAIKQMQTSAFGQDLVVHKSKLEKAKEEATAARKAAELTPTSVLPKGSGFGEGLGAKGRPKQDASAWEGQGLGTLKKHLSRLERDKLAWKEAEEAAKSKTAA